MATQSLVGSNASSNSTTVSMPAGIAAGDRSFFFDSAVASGGTPPTAVAPSGYTLLATHTAAGGGFAVRHSVYWKDLVGSETTITGMAVGVTCNKAVVVSRKSAGATWETPGDVSVVASVTSISNQVVNVPAGAVLVLAYGDDFGTVGTGAARLTMSPAGTYADAFTIRLGYVNYNSGAVDNTCSSSVTAGGVLSSFYQRVLDSTHSLTASNLSTGSASLGTPAVGQVHALGASALATGSPSIGTPAVGQNHALSATALATSSPALGTPAAALVHALTASGLTTASPALGTPAATHVHVLAATALATDSPTIGTPALGQEHALATGGLSTGAAALGTPVITQAHALAATGLTVGSPALGTPAVGQKHGLTASTLATGSPSVGTPAIGSVNVLTADGIATGSPSLGTPAMTNSAVTRALTANGITTAAPQLGAPTVRQVNGLTANSLTTSAPVIGHPGMTLYALGIPSGITISGPVIGTPTLARYRGSAPPLAANVKRRLIGEFRAGSVIASDVVIDDTGRAIRQIMILAPDAKAPAVTLRLSGSAPGRLRFNRQR